MQIQRAKVELEDRLKDAIGLEREVHLSRDAALVILRYLNRFGHHKDRDLSVAAIERRQIKRAEKQARKMMPQLPPAEPLAPPPEPVIEVVPPVVIAPPPAPPPQATPVVIAPPERVAEPVVEVPKPPPPPVIISPIPGLPARMFN